jgi:hypothetical protein
MARQDESFLEAAAALSAVNSLFASSGCSVVGYVVVGLDSELCLHVTSNLRSLAAVSLVTSRALADIIESDKA